MQNKLEEVLEAVNQLADEIYTVEQVKVVELFTTVLDALDNFINEAAKNDIHINMDEELLKLQAAFVKKDYIELADVLLYEIAAELEQLKEENKTEE